MKVCELVEQLQACDPNAIIEVRGTTDAGYQCITEIGVDDNEDLVIIDI
jgi:hypothetical protein